MNYNKLNALLKERNISKLQLAKMCDLSDVTVGRVLRGSDAKISTVEAIAKVLELPVGYFFDEPTQNINKVKGDYSFAGNHNTQSGNTTVTHSQAPTPTTETTEALNTEIIQKQQDIINLNDQIIEAQIKLSNLQAAIKNIQGEQTI